MFIRSALLASAAIIALPTDAYAQAADVSVTQEPQTEDSGTTLSDIVVTARRRAEPLQSVPIAVTAVSGEALEKSTFVNLTDIQYVAPSLVVNNAQAYPAYN